MIGFQGLLRGMQSFIGESQAVVSASLSALNGFCKVCHGLFIVLLDIMGDTPVVGGIVYPGLSSRTLLYSAMA